jgi:heme ABC exporter ATP-binding subunit CcmA
MQPYEGPPLTANALARSYGPLAVLRGVDLTVGAGETLLIAGPNGAGKTTLLRLLAGLMRPTAGEVHVLGRRLTNADPDARRPLGLVSHQSLLYDDLTLQENLAFAARLYGIPRPRDAALAALTAVGLSARSADVPRQLSRGMVQRAAIARALLHDPSVLLLDEPFTGLDAPASARLRVLMTERAAAGCAIVVVTHQLADAWDLATHVAVLAGGRWALTERRAGEVSAFIPRYHELTGA